MPRLLNPILSLLALAALMIAVSTPVQAKDRSQPPPTSEQVNAELNDLQTSPSPTTESEQTADAPPTNAEPSVRLQEDETTWVEEKITPSTRWIENLVSPWTQWMERKIQRQTLHTVNAPIPQGSASEPSEAIQTEIEIENDHTEKENSDSVAKSDASTVISLNEAISRVEALYDGNILGANFIDQIPPLYRIKVLLPNGEIRIVQMNAETGKLW